MPVLLMPTLFGLESCCRDELREAAFASASIRTQDGRVELELEHFEEIKQAVARLNLSLRTAERVLLELGNYRAESFDELFDGCLEIPWEEFIADGAAVLIKGHSRSSKLTSIPSCQRLLKKAIVERLLRSRRGKDGRLPEDPRRGVFRLQFSLVRDRLSLALDCSGAPLHKRGYRPENSPAPLRETLAAAILKLSFYERNLEREEALLDPLCGSGTFAIEAALMQSGRFPGLQRRFAAEAFPWMDKKYFEEERKRARHFVRKKPERINIFAQDKDAAALELAKSNAARAGVSSWISFVRRDLGDESLARLHEEKEYRRFLICCNPPYGERLGDEKEAIELLKLLGSRFFEGGEALAGIRFSLISPEPRCEEYLGATADKKRKLSNGRIPCELFHYHKVQKI